MSATVQGAAPYARAAKLECHWESCALRPEDHARERIEWIISWIVKAEKDLQEMWIELCSQAMSRINGKKVTLKIVQSGDKVQVQMHETTEIHKEIYCSEGGSRELDYSDESMHKDYELHGFGTIMRGPIVPLSS